MDVQEDTPQTSSASEASTEPERAAPGAKAAPGELSDQIPGGRYHIVERLSTGAIGAVYKALDTVLDRPVAVKCVRLDTPLAEQSPEELRERFVREARVAARLQHPNIVTIHDIVATPDRGYIIMEFIEGRTLESLFGSEGRLPLSTAIKILSQLSSALDYAHERNVVHRDVKPSNILVSPSMYVWVTDFGIAKSELSTNLTMAGGVLGTPDYMSPEQAKGEDVDARSDLFSLGCILFEAVVGEKPFRSPSLTGVLLSIINDEPVFPLNWRSLGLPTELKPILHHSLEKNRDKRYPSGEDLMAALGAIDPESVRAADVAAGVAPESADAPARAPRARDLPPGARDAAGESGAGPTNVETVDDTAAEVSGDRESSQSDSREPERETTEALSEDAADAADDADAATSATEERPAPEAGAHDQGADQEGPADESTEEAEASQEPSGASPTTETESAPARTEAASSRDESSDGEVSAEVPDERSTKAAADDAARIDDAARESDESDDVATGSEAAKTAAETATEETTTAENNPAREQETSGSESADADDRADEPDTDEPDTDEAEMSPVSDEQIQSLKDESSVLHLSPTLSGDLQGVEISPEEGFLLSRIDGASRPNDILSVSPMSEADTARALLDLLGKGLIRLGGVTREPVAPAPEPAPPPKPKPKRASGPDAATVSEVDRLLALADAEDYPELLGLSADAPEGKRKSAYLKIVAKFHPDKFPVADASFRDKLTRLCATASEAVTEFERVVEARKSRTSNASSPANGGAPSSNGGDAAPFDKRRHARELYDRALSAYDRADYWDAIQLGRQAIETDEQVAEYYGLLGRALLQNKKWRKEAADNFLKASQLEPNNIDYVGMLGAIYQSEGLTTRASSLLERARTLDPEYEFPDLDGPEVTAD